MMMRKPMIPTGPATVVDKTVKYHADQEHFLRRISSGVLIHWDSLPSDLQDLIIDQAVVVDDRHTETPTTLDIENFIRTVKLARRQPAKAAPHENLDIALASASGEGSSAFPFSK
jgi:hypothetical protein